MSFTPVKTDHIQAESLRAFMETLGYRPARENGGWITDNPYLQGNRQLSTATAIKLHNKGKAGWEKYKVENAPGTWYRPKGMNIDILLSSYGLNVLLASKIVKEVKFQASGRYVNGLVFPQDPLAHLIRPIDKRYLKEFGID